METVQLYRTDYSALMHSHLIKSDDIKKLDRMKRGKKFCTYLENVGIDYQVCIKHPEVLGCDESFKYYQRFKEYLSFKYSICKHILVKEKKGDKRVFLIVIDKDKKVDLSKIREKLDCKKLEFVSEEEMEMLLNTTPGNVSVFNLIEDTTKKVELIMDRELLDQEELAFHPLYNGMTLFLKPLDIIKFLKTIDREVSILDVPEKEQDQEKVKIYS